VTVMGCYLVIGPKRMRKTRKAGGANCVGDDKFESIRIYCLKMFLCSWSYEIYKRVVILAVLGSELSLAKERLCACLSTA
jgi:hypothetical protein